MAFTAVSELYVNEASLGGESLQKSRVILLSILDSTSMQEDLLTLTLTTVIPQCPFPPSVVIKEFLSTHTAQKKSTFTSLPCIWVCPFD